MVGNMLDKYRGCLIGGGAGDALGYAVEFDTLEEIIEKYGEGGIKKYEKINGKGLISDDTQMTLFTANGLLIAHTIKAALGEEADYKELIACCYKDWLKTQESYGETGRFSWLNNVDELNNPRAPGATCMSALYSGEYGSIKTPINDSKGCGGVMRVAPIGLFFSSEEMSGKDVLELAAESAAITHGHPLGYISAAMLACIINGIVHYGMDPWEAINNSRTEIGQFFWDEPAVLEMNALVDKAILLTSKEITDAEAIKELGEGWVGEEALAIAIYCSLKYSDDFEQGIICAVNHSGDSDSTGAITGNILGAYLGLSAIPQKMIDCLECKEVIMEIADDLYYKLPHSSSPRYKGWMSKYVKRDYTLNM